MPDLTIEAAWTCTSNTYWEQVVESSRGPLSYTVRFEHRPWPHEVQYDYTCTCDAFKYGRGKPCKHIEGVRGLRCGWNSELDPGAECETDGDVEAMKVGV